MIVLCGNCGFENSLSPTEKDEGSCTKDGMTCCKRTREREIWGERQMEEQIEKAPTPPPPHPLEWGFDWLMRECVEWLMTS